MPKGKKKVNKMEAVRQIVKKHGKETMPVDIVKLAKEEHGVVMSTDMASTYKSSALKQLGLGGMRKAKRGRKPGRKPAEAATGNGVKAAPKASGGGIDLEDIQAVKALVARMGANKLRELAKVFA